MYLLWICWYSKGLVNVGSSNSLWPHRLKQWSSTKTSLANLCWYSNAILVTIITASGSSPLTWKIGELTTLAKSELYLEDFPRSLGVVKPTYFIRNREGDRIFRLGGPKKKISEARLFPPHFSMKMCINYQKLSLGNLHCF